jgi:signal transduction histidine kinase
MELPRLMDILQAVPEFAAVPRAQIEWIAQRGEIHQHGDGDRVFASGDAIDGFQIVLEGAVALFFTQTGTRRGLGTYERYEIMGRLPYSRMKAAAAEGFAVGDTALFFLHRQYFPDMISQCHDVTEALVHNMTDRVRDFTKLQQQNEKMMALGKLSAGLAHELNNPSAAVVRSAQELKKHLAHIPENFKQVIKIRATDEVVDRVNEFAFGKIQQLGLHPLSMMARSEREDELNDWLEANGFDNAFALAEVFAEYDITPEELTKVSSWLRPEDKVPVIRWVRQVLNTEKLVGEIEEASKRINALVTSVKGYTHMDQAPEKQRTDIHTGIANTLTMLNHKLRKGNVRVVENYQPDLPLANIFVSEMNQVWTNLIDNAIDAMEGRSGSLLEIKTQQDREFIVVSVVDNGPGIPEAIRDKIFDPFFTTKTIGKGTGLGLEVVQRIVSQHQGKVDVLSEPGRTEFRVCFPY